MVSFVTDYRVAIIFMLHFFVWVTFITALFPVYDAVPINIINMIKDNAGSKLEGEYNRMCPHIARYHTEINWAYRV